MTVEGPAYVVRSVTRTAGGNVIVRVRLRGGRLVAVGLPFGRSTADVIADAITVAAGPAHYRRVRPRDER